MAVTLAHEKVLRHDADAAQVAPVYATKVRGGFDATERPFAETEPFETETDGRTEGNVKNGENGFTFKR